MDSEKILLYGGLVVILCTIVWWLAGSGDDLKDEGAPCVDGYECITQTCCDGICKTEEDCKALAIGQECVKNESVCQTGLVCCTGLEDDHWLCRPANACGNSNEGEVCVKQDQCTLGLNCCHTADDWNQQHCKTNSDCVKAIGEQCVKDLECKSTFCCLGKCAEAKKCGDASPKENGSACVTPRDCLSQICSGTPTASCRATLDPELGAVGQACLKNAECSTNVCCASSYESTHLTCQHPHDCLRKDGLLCNTDSNCISGICCEKMGQGDRKKCQSDAVNCKGKEDDPCSVALPCTTGYECCHGNSPPDPTFKCRERNQCLLNTGEVCSHNRECIPGESVCCASDKDKEMRCRPVGDCSEIDCLVKTGYFRSCEPERDSCPSCHVPRVCRSDTQDFRYLEDGLVLPVPAGSWCLPKNASFQCQPYVSNNMFMTDLEKWGCQCKYPKLIGQTSLGDQCDVLLACNKKGVLVHKTDKIPWSIQSTWDPQTDGICECSPGYSFVEEDGYKKCV